MPLPYLVITDDNGNTYNLPTSLFIKKASMKTTVSMQNLMYAVGGKQTGDGYPQATTLEISGAIYADTHAAMNTILRALNLACLKGGKLSINGDIVSKNIDVRFSDFNVDWEHWPNFVDIDIAFYVEFPFWEDVTETSTSKIFSGNDTFTVTVSDCDYLVNPIIEISADQSVDVPSVNIRNINDGGVRGAYNNTNFLSGSLLIIDSKEGTVKLNNNNSIEFYNPAIFLRLQPGANVIYYEGAACTMTVKYKKVYML